MLLRVLCRTLKPAGVSIKNRAIHMNHPQNQQPQAPRGDGVRGGRGGRGHGRGRGGRGGRGGWGAGRGGNHGHRGAGSPQQAAGTIPTVREVIPGTGVFIILKEDQPTGQETRGVVSEVLTSGNHPRGIKVRLRDGQVGRVQRMDKTFREEAPASGSRQVDAGEGAQGTAASPASRLNAGGASTSSGSMRFSHKYTDVRNDDYLEGPPERSFADFLPADWDIPVVSKKNKKKGVKAAADPVMTAKCPMCEEFEGDEAAVTHHIDQVHLS